MIEKIKDLCYDLSDILLSLLIIAIIFFVVSWKISDSLDFKSIPTNPNSQQADIINSDNTIVIETPSSNSDNNDSPTTSATEESNPDIASNSNTTADTQDTTSTNTENNTDKPSAKQGKQTINISAGATGATIAKQLYDAGLIDSTSSFIGRLGERELGAKLQTGTFVLSSDMTMDQIIDKLTGQ